MTRTDLVECLNGYPWEGEKSPFETIDSKTRSSFTRKYNNGVHQQANLWEEENALTSRVAKRSKKRGSTQEAKTKAKVKKEVEEEEESDTDSEAQYVY